MDRHMRHAIQSLWTAGLDPKQTLTIDAVARNTIWANTRQN